MNGKGQFLRYGGLGNRCLNCSTTPACITPGGCIHCAKA